MSREVRITEAVDLRALADSVENLSETLDQLGAVLSAQAQRAIRDGGKHGKKWPGRFTPNTAGIIRDLNNDVDPKARHFEPRRALHVTGTLLRSITHEVRGNEVVVGTSVPYASTQNEGGKSAVKLTKTGRRRLAIWLKGNKERQDTKLGFLFSRPEIEIDVRKREFLGIVPKDRKFIREFLEASLGVKVKVKRGS